jgi:two-component system cell cycle sensor histidine kinase/response regulator CckA
MSVEGEILLVDDTPENLRVLSDLLRAHGLNVRVASSGAMALRSVKARCPDLIMLDIRMPELDGFETCRRLRQELDLIGVPILFLSASDALADRVESFRVGGQDYISKPFQAEEVLARVTVHLALARTRRELDLANERLADQVMTEGYLRGNAESVAAERLARLELVLTASNLGAWEVDPDTSNITFDARARSILGIKPGHHPHWRDFLLLFPDSEADGNSQRWERSIQSLEIFDLEGWWMLPGDPAGAAAATLGQRRRVRLRGRPLSGRGAAPGSMVGVVWDVTAEHRLRERLSQSERLEALGLLAGGVAHDFNNQLSVILAELEIIHLDGDATAQVASHLEHITKAAEASTGLIRDLLSFARRRDLQRSVIDLVALTSQAARIASRSLGPGIAIVTAIADGQLWASGNPGQLENAILNLCINARDAMAEGGRLEIRLERRRVEGAYCQVSQGEFSGEFAVITIRDNGTGIPEEIRSRIFEPFFTTKPDGKGTGLGLAAVLGCVAAHGGHLTVETALGQGTAFAIHLDVAAASAPSAPGNAAPVRRTGRMLLLDDQQAVRDVVADGLRRLGWEVAAFDNAQAALQAWDEAAPPFAIALVDLIMPVMNGATVFRALRARDPKALVVMMSGHTAGENLDALRQEGLAGFVEKPVRLRQLAQLLGSLIEEAAP